MRVVILLALLISVAQQADAQPTSTQRVVPMKLQECLERALKHNLDLQIEGQNNEVSRYNVRAAYEGYVPTFTLRAQHDYISQPGNFDEHKFNPDLPYELNSGVVGGAVTGTAPWGLNYELETFGRSNDARTDFRSDLDHAWMFPGGFRETNSYVSEARITLRQHLLRDFWIDATRQTVLVRRKEMSMSQQALRWQAMRTVLAVEVAYFDLRAAREQVRAQEKALELRQQFLSETKRRVDVGDLPPLEAAQAQTQLQNTLTALESARDLVSTRQNVLKALISDDFHEWSDAVIEPEEVLVAFKPVVNRSEVFARAMKQRPDLLEARMAVERSDVVVKFQKNQLFPALDLVGRYGGLGVNTTAGEALGDAFSSGNPEYYYGVVLTVPLSTIAQNGKYHASKANRRAAELQLKRAEQSVLYQVADLCDRMQTRFNQVETTRKARGYAEEALAAEQKKLANGLSTSFVVLQLQETLTNVRLGEVQALVDYNRAVAELAFAEGDNLDKHRLTVEVK